MISLFHFSEAPRHFRDVFPRGQHTWLAVVPERLRPFWDRLGVPALSTYWDASDKVWILAGSRSRVAVARDESDLPDLFAGV
jgi:hypothetical protein